MSLLKGLCQTLVAAEKLLGSAEGVSSIISGGVFFVCVHEGFLLVFVCFVWELKIFNIDTADILS